MTHLVDKGKVVDFVYPDFSKAFDTVSHCSPFLLEKWLFMAWIGVLGKNLAEWSGPESGGEWSYIKLLTGHKCCSPGPVLFNMYQVISISIKSA